MQPTEPMDGAPCFEVSGVPLGSKDSYLKAFGPKDHTI